MTELQVAEAPRNRWTIGRYQFERYSRAQTGPGSRGRWGCCYRNMIGVSNCRTPIGAFVRLRIWVFRQPRRAL